MSAVEPLTILYRDPRILAVRKPAGMLSLSDPGGDTDALRAAQTLLLEMGEPDDLYPVHRLDRPVGGVLVFARTAAAAAALSRIVAGEGMQKEYFAVLEGVPAAGEYRDYLWRDARAGKAYAVSSPRRGAREAHLTLTPISTVATPRGERTLARIHLHTGRFHQIRVQTASRGTPVAGDGKYGGRDNGCRVALFSAALRFTCFGRAYSFFALPDLGDYPWNLFCREDYTV